MVRPRAGHAPDRCHVNGNYAAVGEPGWYAEFYAQLVFERELPQELEDHYGVYFADRQAIADTFEVDLDRP